ncbi:MAG: type II toxin-antitoxin system VapC family toxin [Actinobacteria bacterium]|nr:type II toxin-antitoxin system VapC family toxin [Actinomycetota bacterium]
MTAGHVLVDTSVAVPVCFAGHQAHRSTLQDLDGMALGLSGHAAFETFSVLTRLPVPARRTPPAVCRLITVNFPHSRFLGAGAAARLLDELPDLGIAGGSVYDALVAACAVEHALPLVTRDRRAADIYRSVGAELQILD